MTNQTQKQDKNKGRHGSLPNPNYPLLLAAALVSVLIHLSSYISLDPHDRDSSKWKRPMDNSQKVKINFVEKKAEPQQRVIEAPMEETKAPVEPKYLGVNDHKTSKETRPKKQKIDPTKALNAGQKGVKKSTAKKPAAPKKTSPSVNIAGTVIIPDRPKPRNAYESLLSSSFDEMQGEVDAGYQDFVDDKIAEGDRIDLNTQEYRYIGYFTILRKSIELVWNYPAAAARKGLQGVVQLEFTIAKTGDVSNIKVLNSSGYYILDRAIVDALRLASPFAPLPKGFGKEKLVITGSFNYVLQSGYASGH